MLMCVLFTQPFKSIKKNKTNSEIETNDRCGVIVFLWWSKNGNPSPNPTIELITAVLTSMIFSQDYRFSHKIIVLVAQQFRVKGI